MYTDIHTLATVWKMFKKRNLTFVTQGRCLTAQEPWAQKHNNSFILKSRLTDSEMLSFFLYMAAWVQHHHTCEKSTACDISLQCTIWIDSCRGLQLGTSFYEWQAKKEKVMSLRAIKVKGWVKAPWGCNRSQFSMWLISNVTCVPSPSFPEFFAVHQRHYVSMCIPH